MNFEIKINENLSLKLRHEEDSEEVFMLTDKNREYLKPWFPWVGITLSPEDSKKFIEDCQKKFKDREAVDLGIVYGGKLIGSMGFHSIKISHEWAEIGYWIDKDFQGKGFMTECVKTIIKYGFDELNLHRIQIKCDTLNLRSKAIPERLGFKLEGIVRESRKNEEGVFSDMLIYGLLRNEWNLK